MHRVGMQKGLWNEFNVSWEPWGLNMEKKFLKISLNISHCGSEFVYFLFYLEVLKE